MNTLERDTEWQCYNVRASVDNANDLIADYISRLKIYFNFSSRPHLYACILLHSTVACSSVRAWLRLNVNRMEFCVFQDVWLLSIPSCCCPLHYYFYSILLLLSSLRWNAKRWFQHTKRAVNSNWRLASIGMENRKSKYEFSFICSLLHNIRYCYLSLSSFDAPGNFCNIWHTKICALIAYTLSNIALTTIALRTQFTAVTFKSPHDVNVGKDKHKVYGRTQYALCVQIYRDGKLYANGQFEWKIH